MNILFFSTNSNNFNGDAWVYTNFPTCRQQLDQFCQNHPDYNVTVATLQTTQMKPLIFLLI